MYWYVTIGIATQYFIHVLINFQKNPKIMKNIKNPKKYLFNIFVSLLAFSAQSQKNLNFQTFVERVRLLMHYLKITDFLIGGDIDQKNSKKQEKSNLHKKKVEGPILRPKQYFAYIQQSSTHTKGGAILHIQRKTQKNLTLKKKPSSSSWSPHTPYGLSSLTLPHQAPLSQPTKEVTVLPAHNLSNQSPLHKQHTPFPHLPRPMSHVCGGAVIVHP